MADVDSPVLTEQACLRALKARDARFDGLFFVGITSTRIYCRPICPARVSNPRNRRFFRSAAAAECAGFRPCRRCRPELAPGHALVDSISRLARVAAWRISAGALNGRPVSALADELHVSERHLRRALERELGVSPTDLAQTQRLLLAKRLLTDTGITVTEVAYASGFQSLRRFNTVFRECYGMRPSDLRRGQAPIDTGEFLGVTLSYRPPFDWSGLLATLAHEALPGVETVAEGRYSCAVAIDGHRGLVVVRNSSTMQLEVSLSRSLLPVLMPLIARLRRLFDLDADPAVVNACLTADTQLAPLVRKRPGLRVPGALDGFGAASRVLLSQQDARRIVTALGEPLEMEAPGLTHTAPDAARVAAAGTECLARFGVTARRADGLVALARALEDGMLTLEPGANIAATQRALLALPGIGMRPAAIILMRALSWPDAFPATDRTLRKRAENWRPWRAYAAEYLSC